MREADETMTVNEIGPIGGDSPGPAVPMYAILPHPLNLTMQADDLSKQRRHRDRDRDRAHDRDRDAYRRRDRSVDRRYDSRKDDDTQYSRKDRDRDRSRDRRRSRDRDERRRSRDRGSRSKRDGSRTRDGRLRGESTESRKRKRDDSRDRGSKRDSGNISRDVSHLPHPAVLSELINLRQISKPSTPTAQTAEDQKTARLAKLEAWKKKQAEEQAKKQKQLEAAGGARSILKEIDDRQAGILPTTASPRSPATSDPAPSTPPIPAPYAGKFDPKAIVKKAHHSSPSNKVLGGDIAAPVNTNGVSKGSQASPKSPANGLPAAKALKAKGNLGKFGLVLKQRPTATSLRKAWTLQMMKEPKRSSKGSPTWH